MTPSSSLARRVCERVHAKPRGHRPGAVQRHLPTTAGACVADALTRGSSDRSHVDAVRTAHGALPGVHCRAASGTSCAAMHASVAQCASSPNLVRVPITHSWEFPSPSPSDTHEHYPESPSSCSNNYHYNCLSHHPGIPIGASPQFSNPSRPHTQILLLPLGPGHQP